MKISFTMKPIHNAFGGGNQFALNLIHFLEKKGIQIVYDLNDDDIDVIFVVDPRILKYNKVDFPKVIEYKHKHPNVKVIHRVNDCDKPRDYKTNLDEILINCFKTDDLVIFVSKWTRKYFLRKTSLPTNLFINNGCNQNYFYPPSKKKFCPSHIKIVTHHWSNNWNKGFEYYQKLDEYIESHPEISFTFIGRNFPNDYQPKNITVIGPYFGIELGNKLREFDIYITASKFENCPMHVVEALSTGLPILYHKDLGGGVEICKKHGGEEYSSFEECIQKLEKIRDNYFNYVKKINFKELGSYNCCQKYYDEIIKITQNDQ